MCHKKVLCIISLTTMNPGSNTDDSLGTSTISIECLICPKKHYLARKTLKIVSVVPFKIQNEGMTVPKAGADVGIHRFNFKCWA